MKIVLFFQSTTRKSWLEKLAGVHRFAQKNAWFLQVVERIASAGEIRRALATWKPAGCLVDRAMTLSRAPDAVFKGVPTVYLDQNPAAPSAEHPCLLHDSAASASMALEELLRVHCASLAYLGTDKSAYWDTERCECARRFAAAAGLPFAVLNRKTLASTLKKMPLPCGILGANDFCAMEAYHAATAAKFKIPEEIRIVGIDNDAAYCESVTPDITSVEPDFEGAGWRLAGMLEKEMNGASSVRTEYYGPLRIVRRGSTATEPKESLRIRRAREFIARHACEKNISINGVAAVMGCSRSLATGSFRKETGHSILDEIHELRFAKMCELLSRSTTPISMIVESCGYASDGFAQRFFAKRTGMTMREYRKQTRAAFFPED